MQRMQLTPVRPADEQFRFLGFYGKADGKDESDASIQWMENIYGHQKDGGCKPSIIVRDLMYARALKFYASNCREWLVNIQGQPDQDGQEASKGMVKPLIDLQEYFSKQFFKLINRMGQNVATKIRQNV